MMHQGSVNAASVALTAEDFRALERTRLRAMVARDMALPGSCTRPTFSL